MAKVSIVLIGLFGIIIGTSIPSIMSGLMAAIQMTSTPRVDYLCSSHLRQDQ